MSWQQVFLCGFLCVLGGQTKDADPKNITKVHLVFMNHLDVGFNGILPKLGFVNNVVNKYFTVYFPLAINVALQLELLGYEEKFVYTTHPWLVSMYLDCPPDLTLAGIKLQENAYKSPKEDVYSIDLKPLQCPNKTEVSNFEAAVTMGIITWHAGAMNMINEMFDASMMDFSLQISEDLDKRFKITRPSRVLSQRDVPGMSKALLPIFAKHGIEGITVGVNGVTAPPAVPKIFRWEFQNASLIAMWHPGGYPDSPGNWPKMAGGLSSKDCVTFKGFSEALCFAFRSDNQGPPSTYQEVLLDYEIARGQFPNAKVDASTFENFVAAAQSIKSELPVVTNEIGNGWIQGSPSDPYKCAMMRAFMRARTSCLSRVGNSSSCPDDARLYNASRFLTKLGEHTWGISSAGDTINWENKNFYKFLENETASYMQGPLSWIEQRQFTDLALDALGSHPLAEEVKVAMKELRVGIPDLTNYHIVSDPTAMLPCKEGYKFQFASDGSVITLMDKNGTNWASVDHPIGQYVYQTYDQSDFDAFDKLCEYSNKFFLGIGKPNMSKNASPKSQMWEHTVVDLYQANDGSCKFGVNLKPVSSDATFYYGAPPKVYIWYSIGPSAQGKPSIAVELQWMEKPPTRLPEAIFFTFKPAPRANHKWMMHKLGQMLDPMDVIQNGSQTQHGVDKGMYYIDDSSKGLELLSLDAPITTMLTSTAKLSAIPQQLSPLQDMTGVSFNIFNNVWNVNYIFWYPYMLDDMNQKFRFFLTFL